MAIHTYLTTRTPTRNDPQFLSFLWWLLDEHEFHATELLDVLEKPGKYEDYWDTFQGRRAAA